MNVVLGIVLKGDMVLLVKRQKEEGELVWVFPGGKTEGGESLEAAVVREVREESGVECEIVRRIGERIHPITQVNLSYYLCEYVGGDLRNRDGETSEARWVTVEEVFGLITTDIFKPVHEILEKIKQTGAS